MTNSMSKKQLETQFGPIRQIGYIVPDIEEAIKTWNEKYGVGPFLLTRNASPLANAFYRGKPSEKVVLNIAFAYIGDLQLELIEQVNDVPSMYKEALTDPKRKRLHHYAVCVEDFPSSYKHSMENGFAAIVDAGFDGLARMSYIEMKDNPKLILEVIEWNDITRPYFDGIKKLVDNANPNQLIHEFKLSQVTPIGAVLKLGSKYLVKKLFGLGG